MPLKKGQRIRRVPPKPIAERFHGKYVVDAETGCWLWTAHVVTATGYGTLGSPGRGDPMFAHRVSYELHVGKIPEGLVIDHLCRVRHCVNPAHLEAVTQRENNRRGVGWSGVNARKTECKHGHEFTPENTYWNPDGLGRRCRECMRRDTRRWRSERTAA